MITPAMPFAEYITTEAMSASRLKKIYKGGTAAHALVQDNKMTEALAIGRAVHCMTMRPDDYEGEHIVATQDDVGLARTNKKYDKWVKENAEEVGDKTVMLESEMESVQIFSDALKAHPRVSQFLAKGEPELGIVTTDPEFEDLKIKALIDWRMGTHGLDFKVMKECGPRKFQRDLQWTFDYDLQAAWYSHVHKVETGNALTRFFFVCLDKDLCLALVKAKRDPSEAVAVYECGEATMDRGAEKWREAIEIWTTYNAGSLFDEWAGYSQSPVELL